MDISSRRTSMQIVVKGKNMEVNERLRQFVEGKLSRLSRVLPSIAEAEVELSTERTKSTDTRYVAQVTLKTNGALIRAEQSAGDAHSAVDVVLDKLDRQVNRYKAKRTNAKGGGETRLRVAKGQEVEPDLEDEEEEQGRLVRTKRFAMKPMDIEEALEQMEFLGHTFYVFINSETNAVSVAYQRNDGNFGLIEPKKV
jgi:putative sigma-54 modulation protein